MSEIWSDSLPTGHGSRAVQAKYRLISGRESVFALAWCELAHRLHKLSRRPPKWQTLVQETCFMTQRFLAQPSNRRRAIAFAMSLAATAVSMLAVPGVDL